MSGKECTSCGGEGWIGLQEDDMPAPVTVSCPECTVVIDPVADSDGVRRTLVQAGWKATSHSGDGLSGTFDPLRPA